MRLLIWIVTTLSSAGLGILGGYLIVRLIQAAVALPWQAASWLIRNGTPLNCAILKAHSRMCLPQQYHSVENIFAFNSQSVAGKDSSLSESRSSSLGHFE